MRRRRHRHQHSRRPAIKSRTAKSRQRISDKISVLRREGKDSKQAAGMAYGMENSGRLRKGGKYIHKRKSTLR
jgi:hypothetical protein